MNTILKLTLITFLVNVLIQNVNATISSCKCIELMKGLDIQITNFPSCPTGEKINQLQIEKYDGEKPRPITGGTSNCVKTTAKYTYTTKSTTRFTLTKNTNTSSITTVPSRTLSTATITANTPVSVQITTTTKSIPTASPNISKRDINTTTYKVDYDTLVKLPKCVGQMNDVRSLIMSVNADISPIANLTQLVSLSISYNKSLKVIPKFITKFDKLTHLSIRDCNLEKIPEYLGNVKSLESIDLGYNKISGIIPESIKNLKNLKSISISDNIGIYDYVPEMDLSYCYYGGTNMCYRKGFTGCTSGASECTKEQILKIERVRRGLPPEKQEGEVSQCWSEDLGFPCCGSEDSKIVYFTDESGEWGVNVDSQWCGIVRDGTETFGCKEEKLGYKCCKSESSYVLTDSTGVWGVENDEWCGFTEI